MMNSPELASNSPYSTPLTPKMEAVALLLASGKTQEDAGRKAGVGYRTVKTWLAERHDFRDRIAVLRSEMTSRALGRLVEGMTCAADTLLALARKAKAETVRLGAARAILELGVKLRESIELEARISDLERRSL